MSALSGIIRCEGVRKNFGLNVSGTVALEVLKGVDLTVAQGEMIAIIGASGSGKSTLLHLLGGLDRPTSGAVHWEGKNIFAMKDDHLAHARATTIGFVFQFHHLLPEFSALENVMIPQMILGRTSVEAGKRAHELLERVHLSGRVHHRPSEMSGGEQQRVAVARALANRPMVVLADEPSGNLDTENSIHLHELLLELNTTERQTFVIVTHNEGLARLSSRVLRMSDGRLEIA